MRITRIAKTDWEVRLECVCADDFGAHYKDESEWTEENKQDVEKYNQTREAHLALKELTQFKGIRSFATDSDDNTSLHSDAYLYFNWSNLDKILSVLKESGAQGDILDVPSDFPPILENKIKKMGWHVGHYS